MGHVRVIVGDRPPSPGLCSRSAAGGRGRRTAWCTRLRRRPTQVCTRIPQPGAQPARAPLRVQTAAQGVTCPGPRGSHGPRAPTLPRGPTLRLCGALPYACLRARLRSWCARGKAPRRPTARAGMQAQGVSEDVVTAAARFRARTEPADSRQLVYPHGSGPGPSGQGGLAGGPGGGVHALSMCGQEGSVLVSP